MPGIRIWDFFSANNALAFSSVEYAKDREKRKKKEKEREKEKKIAENLKHIRKFYKIRTFYIDIFQKIFATRNLNKFYKINSKNLMRIVNS